MTETLIALEGGHVPDPGVPVRRPQVQHFVFDREAG
jgi:hypothetical protein